MTAPDDASRAAARWDARLRAPDCSDAERAAFEAWRASEPRNSLQFDTLQAAIALMGHMRDDSAEPAAALPRPRTRWVAIAAAACLPFVALVSALPFIGSYGGEVEYSAAASGRPVALDDGAMVLLGPGSTIRVKQHSQGPEVRLVSGQATFSIADKRDHPLIVYAADRNITASGTTFGVGLLPGHVRVSLIRGQAKVRCWHGLLPSVMTLHQGQQITAEVGTDKGTLGSIA